ARMALMEGAYPTQDARRGFFLRAVRALRANPQFQSAAMSDRFRMTFAGQGQYEVDGQNYTTDRDRPRGNFESVSDNYFATLGLKILEGRDFTIDDTDAKQPVAIVNTSFARKYYGNESPIGRRIRIYNPGQPQAWRAIVGVVAFVPSAVGLYGVMSFSVTQRTQEFGIRMALGADAARIFRMVMTQGAWQLGIGLVLGAGGAALLLGVLAAAALQNILFKV